jgi:hypothetical protein
MDHHSTERVWSILHVSHSMDVSVDLPWRFERRIASHDATIKSIDTGENFSKATTHPATEPCDECASQTNIERCINEKTKAVVS